MEAFLLEHEHHIPFLLPFYTWRDLSSLSSCSPALTHSRLRAEFLHRSVVVIPARPSDDPAVRNVLSQLSPFVCRVATSQPSHLGLLARLPHLSTLRVAKLPDEASQDDDDSDSAIRFSYPDVVALWRLHKVERLELDAWVEDLVLLFRDMARLKSLDLIFRYHIGSLDLLAHMSDIHTLCVRGETLDDISALRRLTQLVTLKLSSWAIHDLSSLWFLTELQILDLSRCNVVDLRPIATLPNLQCITLEQTPLSDLTPLANLSTLRELNVAHSHVTDLSPLGALAASLQSLNISCCTLSRVSALRRLVNLQNLVMQRTTWPSAAFEPDIASTVACLSHLRYLDGRVNTFTPSPDGSQTRLQIATLQHLHQLEHLELTCDSLRGQMVSIALPSLVSLRVEWNYSKERDIPLGVVSHPRLRKLQLMHVRLLRLQNLRFTPHLQELRLTDVYLDDLSMLPVARELKLVEITCAMVHSHYIDENERVHAQAPAWDLHPLSFLPKLEYLDLSYTSVHDLQPLRGLRMLRYLDLSSSDVVDLTPLNPLQKLETLWLRDTEIEHFDCGAFCDILKELALPEDVDCSAIRMHARQLKRLLHPNRNCLWTGHNDDDQDDRMDSDSHGEEDGESKDLGCTQS